ncbi:MAG: dimethylarginine dimethylaminohydrolase family protein [Rhodothermia bacterium]|nr:MAG: dimethylarginine dimethylaminohydrolase family protein [Rhodothermia bacterium]
MSEPLRDVLVRHPSVAFESQEFLAAHWEQSGYTACPDFFQACSDFDKFVEVLESSGATIHEMDDEVDAGMDSLYVHDPALTIGNGIVLGRMGKEERRNEAAAFEAYCRSRNILILGRIESPGLLEGGDVIWLDEQTLAVGLGYRTNKEGVRQLRKIVENVVEEIIPVPLPHFRGPGDVLHLMSLISPVARNKAVVYRKFLPVPFLRTLKELKYALIDVPDDEYDKLGCNVLAISPTVAIVAEGTPKTRAKLEDEGIRVLSYPPGEISLKGQGGPTCLTRPLVRR